MREFIKVMKALSDPNRVKMIKLLQRKVMCVCEITEALGLAQSSISKHLKIQTISIRTKEDTERLPSCHHIAF